MSSFRISEKINLESKNTNKSKSQNLIKNYCTPARHANSICSSRIVRPHCRIGEGGTRWRGADPHRPATPWPRTRRGPRGRPRIAVAALGRWAPRHAPPRSLTRSRVGVKCPSRFAAAVIGRGSDAARGQVQQLRRPRRHAGWGGASGRRYRSIKVQIGPRWRPAMCSVQCTVGRCITVQPRLLGQWAAC